MESINHCRRRRRLLFSFQNSDFFFSSSLQYRNPLFPMPPNAPVNFSCFRSPVDICTRAAAGKTTTTTVKVTCSRKPPPKKRNKTNCAEERKNQSDLLDWNGGNFGLLRLAKNYNFWDRVILAFFRIEISCLATKMVAAAHGFVSINSCCEERVVLRDKKFYPKLNITWLHDSWKDLSERWRGGKEHTHTWDDDDNTI